MAILEGTTENGALVPVQVTDEGRVVAEGLTGPEGPEGPQGPQGEKGDQGDPGSPGNLWSGTDPGDISYTGGSVGIGTSSPSRRLSVRNSALDTEGIALHRNTGDGTLIIGLGQNADGHGLLGVNDTSGNRRVQLLANGSSYFTGGRVGIGTTSPASILHVQGSNPELVIQTTNPNEESDIVFRAHTAGEQGLIRYSLSDNSLRFATSGIANERARLDDSGRFLLGLTTAPAGTLAGDVVCQGAVVLQSPDGMWWAIEVANDGTLFALQTAIR